MKYEKCKVVMLSTKKVTDIIKTSKGVLVYQKKPILVTGEVSQHLYILSDEEIKEGDWYYINLPNVIQFASQTFIRGDKTGCFKIIASTDKSLGLARPSDSFIKKYCELGRINEVLVEYEEYVKLNDNLKIIHEGHRPKIAPDNTITVKSIKSSWNREEVELLLEKALSFYRPDNDGYPGLIESWNRMKSEWIKNNL